MRNALAHTVVYLTLFCGAYVMYVIARGLKFTVDQALLVALISVICTVGSWHL